MTASVANTAASAPPSAAANSAHAATAKPGAAGAGALAGFEALIAALFPDGAPAGAGAAAVGGSGRTPSAKGPNGAAGEAKSQSKKGADADGQATHASVGDEVAPPTDPNAALATSLAAASVATSPLQTQTAANSGSDAAAPVIADGKAHRQPFASAQEPPVTNAADGDAAAGGIADAATAPAATPEHGNTAKPAAKSASDSAPPAWGRDKPAGQPAAPALEHAAPHAPGARAEAADLPDAAPPAPPTDPNAAPAGGEQPAALAAAVDAAQTAESKAPTGRPTKPERGKASDKEIPADMRPTEAVDRPVHARSAESAGRAVAASAVSDSPAADEGKAAKDAEPEAASNDPGPDAPAAGETRAAAQPLAASAHAVQPVRGSPETVATLAAQIIKKLEGRSTQFDLELNPAGLGKVDVRVEIGAHGRMTAALTCDNPHAAAELKARASELQQALEQAGFDVSGGLSFDVAGDGRQQGQAWQDQAQDRGGVFRSQAFRAALENAGEADAAGTGPLRLRRGVSAGLDLRI